MWWTKLWECFQASAVEAVSQSQVAEWMRGSFIQSHWPCMTLWPISMFSRIFAAERAVVPATQAPRLREARSRTRPSTASRRCISIMLSM